MAIQTEKLNFTGALNLVLIDYNCCFTMMITCTIEVAYLLEQDPRDTVKLSSAVSPLNASSSMAVIASMPTCFRDVVNYS
jgi:hypothetical protein